MSVSLQPPGTESSSGRVRRLEQNPGEELPWESSTLNTELPSSAWAGSAHVRGTWQQASDSVASPGLSSLQAQVFSLPA